MLQGTSQENHCSSSLVTWQKSITGYHQYWCRLKASLERLQRLTQGYADAMLAIFPERTATLGSALGLEPERVTVRSPSFYIYIVGFRDPLRDRHHP